MGPDVGHPSAPRARSGSVALRKGPARQDSNGDEEGGGRIVDAAPEGGLGNGAVARVPREGCARGAVRGVIPEPNGMVGMITRGFKSMGPTLAHLVRVGRHAQAPSLASEGAVSGPCEPSGRGPATAAAAPVDDGLAIGVNDSKANQRLGRRDKRAPLGGLRGLRQWPIDGSGRDGSDGSVGDGHDGPCGAGQLGDGADYGGSVSKHRSLKHGSAVDVGEAVDATVAAVANPSDLEAAAVGGVGKLRGIEDGPTLTKDEAARAFGASASDDVVGGGGGTRCLHVGIGALPEAVKDRIGAAAKGAQVVGGVAVRVPLPLRPHARAEQGSDTAMLPRSQGR